MIFSQQLSVLPVPRCLSNLTSRWMNYSVYYFSSPWGLPHAYLSVFPSIHPSIRLSACTGVRTVKKIPLEDHDIKRLKSSLHSKFQAYDCHTTAPNTPVKAAMLLQFQAREINSALQRAESNKVAVISGLKCVSYSKIWMRCSCGR